MKTFLKFSGLLALGLLLYLSPAQAQVRVSVNAPVWGPRVPRDVQYYYLPEIDGYYDLYSGMYVFYDPAFGDWVSSPVLPRYYAGYDPRYFHPVVIEYVGRGAGATCPSTAPTATSGAYVRAATMGRAGPAGATAPTLAAATMLTLAATTTPAMTAATDTSGATMTAAAIATAETMITVKEMALAVATTTVVAMTTAVAMRVVVDMTTTAVAMTAVVAMPAVADMTTAVAMTAVVATKAVAAMARPDRLSNIPDQPARRVVAGVGAEFSNSFPGSFPESAC